MGDWNTNLLDPNDSDTRFLNNLTNGLSLKLVNTGPSHHTAVRILSILTVATQTF